MNRRVKPAADILLPRRRSSWLAAGAVFAVALAVFWPVLRNGFVDWDDTTYFLGNPHYRGLSWTHLKWMWTTRFLANYIPLTWMTLGWDYSVWRMDPRGYHLTSAVIHALNAAVFFFLSLTLLRRAGFDDREDDRAGLPIAAAFSALLFAVHPLRVESVAWISERKDVLGGFFFLTALLAYAEYAREGRRRWRWATLALFLGALLSKPTTAALPAVLLILDYYPLRRWGQAGARVWTEKIPFFVLALAAGALAVLGQSESGATRTALDLSFPQRLAQASYGAAFYLRKTVWPVGLSPLYEWPESFDPLGAAFVASAAASLGAAGALFHFRRRWPAFWAAWLCYAACLAPNLGFIHVGVHLVADRYSYLACLSWALLAGAGLLLGWRSDRLSGRGKPIVLAAALAIIATLGALTRRQALVWRDSEALWSRTVLIEPRSYFGHNNLGIALLGRGRTEDAMAHFRTALAVNPKNALVHNFIGLGLLSQGRADAAEAEFDRALSIAPSNAFSFYGLGNAAMARGRAERAAGWYRRALDVNPEYAEAHTNLAVALASQEKWDEAEGEARKVMDLAPDSADAHNNLGIILARRKKIDEAMSQYRRAIALDPLYAKAYDNMGVASEALGNFKEAADWFREVLRIRPDSAEARAQLAGVLARQPRQIK